MLQSKSVEATGFSGPRIFRQSDIVEDPVQLGIKYGSVRKAELVLEGKRIRVSIKETAVPHGLFSELKAVSLLPPHENIARLLGILPQQSNIAFVVEMAQGGSLVDVLRDGTAVVQFRRSPHRVARILRGILLALDLLHSNGFVHRDVASSKRCTSSCVEVGLSGNILLSSADPATQISKLADWGWC